MAFLEQIKTALEIEGAVYDNQLLNYVNQNIAFLINNNIPITQIDDQTETWPDVEETDIPVILEYLQFNAMIKLDSEYIRQAATANYISDLLAVDLNLLKAKYDRPKNEI